MTPDIHLTMVTFYAFNKWIKENHPGWRAPRIEASEEEDLSQVSRATKLAWYLEWNGLIWLSLLVSTVMSYNETWLGSWMTFRFIEYYRRAKDARRGVRLEEKGGWRPLLSSVCAVKATTVENLLREMSLAPKRRQRKLQAKWKTTRLIWCEKPFRFLRKNILILNTTSTLAAKDVVVSLSCSK